MTDFADGCGWMLHPSVGLRPEPFGALAYHYGTRRLTFLKDRTLTAVVSALADHPDVRSTLVALGVPAERHPTYVAALDRLADADVIRIRTPQPEVSGVR